MNNWDEFWNSVNSLILPKKFFPTVVVDLVSLLNILINSQRERIYPQFLLTRRRKYLRALSDWSSNPMSIPCLPNRNLLLAHPPPPPLPSGKARPIHAFTRAPTHSLTLSPSHVSTYPHINLTRNLSTEAIFSSYAHFDRFTIQQFPIQWKQEPITRSKQLPY